jgi:hypothetical protein
MLPSLRTSTLSPRGRSLWAYGLICVCLALAACGGDDGNSTQRADAPPPEAAPIKAPAAPEAKPAVPEPKLAGLDADGNGLYDDVERKALLDTVQQLCPELRQEVFDANGDERVDIAEMSKGRHPLSMIIPRRIVEAPTRIPWTIDLFPEWISTAFLQEDAPQDGIGELTARGTVASLAAQPVAGLRPARRAPRGGVLFAADSGQHLTMPGHRDARWSYRWCVFTFRIDATTGAQASTVLLDINSGQGPNRSSPKIWYTKGEGLSVQYLGKGSGIDRRLMTAGNVVADGSAWNVLVCGIRQGRMFAAVNGVPLRSAVPQPSRFGGEMVQEATSTIGDRKPGNMAWACDAVVLGITEPSEAMVDKLGGWAAHRLGFADRLPSGHAYRTQRPVLDLEDFPHRYVHDDEKWMAWGQTLGKERTRVNTGGPRVEPLGFERVFHDDFRRNRIGLSTSAESDLWGAPGWNTSVGAGVPLLIPGRKPEVYLHDAAAGTQTLALDSKDGRWFGSAFCSVNDMGQGYTWAGPKIFRIRCMFPQADQADLAPGLFPAFWSYGSEFLFWRTSNRIEADWFEFDGKDGWWLNGVATHLHYAHLKSVFPKRVDSYKRFKVFGSRMKEETIRSPGGLFVWDGRFRTWEFVVDQDMFFVNVTVERDGREQWIELARCPTAPTYLERMYLLLDYALKVNKDGSGPPKAGAGRQDFVVDWVEVLQKSEDVRRVPPPFASRPILSGEARVDGTITCDARLPGTHDVRYYWFADGYPLTYGADETFRITAAEAGTRLRCMVKAVGARDMPEAWSDEIAVPTR